MQVPPAAETFGLSAAAAGQRMLYTSWTGAKNIEFQSIGVSLGSADATLTLPADAMSATHGRDTSSGAVGSGEPFVIIQAASLS